MASENYLTQLQQRRNATSSSGWLRSAQHRERVTQLILDRQIEARPSLCILGAGNCNDLDLELLSNSFEQITLVDIDAEAINKGIVSQQRESDQRIQVHASCDVTGVWPELSSLRTTHDENDIDELVKLSDQWAGLPNLGANGTVVSTCLLSQLIDGVIQSLGEAHPRYLDVIVAIRQRHIKLLYELTVSGGNAILITDFVSTDTAPGLSKLSGNALSETLFQMLKSKNFFTGLNPLRLQTMLYEDAELGEKIDSIHCEEPWLWDFGIRTYAVTGISFRKK